MAVQASDLDSKTPSSGSSSLLMEARKPKGSTLRPFGSLAQAEAACAVRRAHAMSQGDESLDEVAADEPGSTGDESSGRGSAHHRTGLIISDFPFRGNRFSAVARGNRRFEGPCRRAGFLRRARVAEVSPPPN